MHSRKTISDLDLHDYIIKIIITWLIRIDNRFEIEILVMRIILSNVRTTDIAIFFFWNLKKRMVISLHY